MKDMKRLAFAILAIVISLAFFLLTLGATLPAIAKALLAVGSLAACGITLSKLYKLEGWYGMFLFRSQSGLKFIDDLAQKHKKEWQVFAEIGMVIGYGSLAYFLLPKRKLEWKRVLMTYGVGTIMLILLTSIVAQLASSVLFTLLSGSDGQRCSACNDRAWRCANHPRHQPAAFRKLVCACHCACCPRRDARHNRAHLQTAAQVRRIGILRLPSVRRIRGY
ncbi:MAG: hypothetical protein NTV88_01905 [Candidatus Micrarchaeota archaeon]|nr:hypothetical protein [Candidatus Micrarchaeota archaeon]